jgi:hypothetical protein
MAILGSFVTFLGFTSLVPSQPWFRQRDFFRQDGHLFQPHSRASGFVTRISKPGDRDQIHNVAAHRPRAAQRYTYNMRHVRPFRRAFDVKT